ncbi:uncharacterized protein LOC132034737 [Lycium ferocissimum]|uniref:uncharacterized protein LOC132034737 n=1 Tax=Lycium ferocissimum TaxID=112874 RepID=UPI002814D901|nr:uncharacterized protein LOC132034737 [Lycium ferocissimum]
MLIEVNVTTPLPEEIKVVGPKGRQFQQDVEFEWKPKFCSKCQVIGHICKESIPPKQPVKQPRKRRENMRVPQAWRSKRVMQNLHQVEEQVAMAPDIPSTSQVGLHTNYQKGVNGRIWVLWDNACYDVQVLQVEDQLIHCLVEDVIQYYKWLVTVVYGFNTRALRKTLWWMGNAVTAFEVKFFSECIQNTALTELAWKGEYFTWSNKQLGNARVCTRIDRVFGNHEWMMNWGHIVIEYEVPNVSDHAPMVLSLKTSLWNRKTPLFFNIWATHDKFLPIVSDRWKYRLVGHRMKDVWFKLKALKPDLRHLNNTEFKYISQKIEKARKYLDKVQRKLTSQCTDEDIIAAVQEFFTKGRMYKAINCTAITLIPKTAYTTTNKEYRPIACCTVLYKIISKVLASRMQNVIASVISESQIMEQLRFPRNYIAWVMECQNAAKGLRQGDPMSPFLFALVMEYLSRGLNDLINNQEYKFHPESKPLGITHLSFADDLLLFSRGDLLSILAMQKKLCVAGESVITKKALEAWERVCSPKSCGGLNLINLQLWNRAAIAKHCWDVAHKQDKIWIKWIHMYYIKDQSFFNCACPKQASWMVKKIINARSIVASVQVQGKPNQSLIRFLYLNLTGDPPRVSWKCVMFDNAARPKARFPLWLLMHGKLRTIDRLLKWGMNVDPECSLCHQEDDTREHLFVKCDFTRRLWTRLLN